MQMEEQEESNWCWAAVAVSVHNFLEPGSVRTQRGLATDVLLDEAQIPAGVNCTSTPGLCNFTARLRDALGKTGNLEKEYVGGHASFKMTKDKVNLNLPVCARIVWDGGGAHFVLIDGYREFASGARQVHVQDPLYGPSFQFYEDFVSDYPPGGQWQDTYTVKT